MSVGYRTGWGRNVGVNSRVRDVSNFKEDLENSDQASGLPIGLGRSYGDSSLNASGTSWSTQSQRELSIDLDQKIATCGSGVTIGELEREALKHGLFPKVVPGTEFVTIGGAIASNIHGKSHQRFGSFADQLHEMTMMDSQGSLHRLTPGGESSVLFWATVGGMGLTGAILSAKVSLMEVETAYVVSNETRVHSVEELLETLTIFDSNHLYTVAWVDLSRNFTGRGLVSGANPAKLKDLPIKLQAHPFLGTNPGNLSIPDLFPSNFINKHTVSAFNSIWFHKPLAQGVQHLRPFLHPLDSIRNWNRIYGKAGFIQYQILVPYKSEDFIVSMLQELKNISAYSFLSVIKRLGTAETHFLSFSEPGWTIAIDIHANTPGLQETLDNLDSQLSRIGGRVYLTKDSFLKRETFERMYPKHEEWKEIKQKIDPDCYWQSEQGKRLGLC